MANAGQSKYVDLLLQRYIPALRRLAFSYAREGSAAEDLFQEIAMALWTALPRFRGDSSERTWYILPIYIFFMVALSRQRPVASRRQFIS